MTERLDQIERNLAEISQNLAEINSQLGQPSPRTHQIEEEIAQIKNLLEAGGQRAPQAEEQSAIRLLEESQRSLRDRIERFNNNSIPQMDALSERLAQETAEIRALSERLDRKIDSLPRREQDDSEE